MFLNENDWKIYESNLPNWQEKYMNNLCREYEVILSCEDTPSDKFWKLEKRINEDKERPEVRITKSEQDMISALASLYLAGSVTDDDLKQFSEKTQYDVLQMIRLYKH